MVKVLVTRTAPGALKTLSALDEMGVEAIPAITAEIRPQATGWPALAEAIAVTSPNGAAWAVSHAPSTTFPVYAVGAATAAVMREAGFGDVTSADGDAAALSRLIAEDSVNRRIVHVRGADQAFDLVADLNARGVEAISLIAYVAQRVDALPLEALDAMTPGSVVLIHSAMGAERLVQLAGDRLAGLRAVVISDAAALPLQGAGLSRIDIAASPNEGAVLQALAATLV
jgi:uroporphyrinogen-III synthase